MAAKKTVIVEENQDDVLFHPRVIAENVNKLEKAMLTGFSEVKNEIHNQSANFATQAALDGAKREADLKHGELRAEIAEVRREASRSSRIIAWVGRTIISIVIAAILGLVIYNGITGVHH